MLDCVKHCLVALAVVAVTGGIVQAKDVSVTYETQGRAIFTFAAPDNWQVLTGFEVLPSDFQSGETPAPRIVSLFPLEGDRVMWSGLWSPTTIGRLDELEDYLALLAPQLLSDVRVTFRDERLINGRESRIVSGTGTKDGRDLDFALVAIQVRGDRVAMAGFIGQPEIYDRYEGELIGIMNSIRAVESQ